jgi:hypothetical protein
MKRLSHTNPLSEGYVGVSSNIEKRLLSHKKSNHRVGKAIRKYNDIVCGILCENLSEKEALTIERSYRPEENIGWNHAKGGGKPPPCKPGIKRGKEWHDKITKVNKERYDRGVGLGAWNGSSAQKEYLKEIYAGRVITWGDKISASKKLNPWPKGNPMDSDLSRKKVSDSKTGTKGLYKDNNRKMAIPGSSKWNLLVADGWVSK